MKQNHVFTKDDLIDLKPEHDSFVGIDSDGCVFDTMAIKQKKCMHRIIVSHWHLEPIEKHVRETAEFVNLYSSYRGGNRFRCLLLTFDLLRDRPEANVSGVELPEFESLRKFVDSGMPLANSSLEKLAAETGDSELADLLAWSKAVNADIAKVVRNVRPFKWVVESLKKIKENSDAICVSQTPAEALIREWRANGLTSYVRIIAGQELGSKTEHLRMAAKGKYAPNNILMIGDAPGDMKSAKGVSALFYPINPGHEVESWKRFLDEAYDKFLNGSYAGEYEAGLIAEFNHLLPKEPPWRP